MSGCTMSLVALLLIMHSPVTLTNLILLALISLWHYVNIKIAFFNRVVKKYKCFLVACTRLYKPLGWLVGQSVGLSVRR